MKANCKVTVTTDTTTQITWEAALNALEEMIEHPEGLTDKDVARLQIMVRKADLYVKVSEWAKNNYPTKQSNHKVVG